MARSRPKLTFNITDDSFVLPAEFFVFNLNKPIGACWAPDLGILAAQNEIEQGYMSVDGIQNWYGRILTLSAQISGSSASSDTHTSTILNGATGDGTTMGGAIGLLNGSYGNTYTITIVEGGSGATTEFSPTNKFRPNWWAVHNFLQYGSRCIVGFDGRGFTGELGPGGTFGISNPLTTVEHFAIPGLYSILFQSFHSDTGNVLDGGWDEGISWVQCPDNAAVHTITNALKISEFPIIGVVNVGITAGAVLPASIGVDEGTEYIVAVAGDKYHLNSVSSDAASSMIRTHLAPDVAGVISNTQAPWISPAGPKRGRILNTVKLAYKFTTTAQDALYDANVNSVILVPGSGVQLFGDITNAPDNSNLLAINVIRTIIYIKSALLPIAADVLFEINNSDTRDTFTLRATSFLSRIQAAGGLTDFSVLCDESNNPQALIDARVFAADIKVKIPGSINYINITLTNK